MKTQMPFNNEIEKTKKEIEVLTAKLALLEELEKTKSPVEEAYKKVYGVYPTNEITYNSMWGVFQKGYYAAQEDYKVGKFQEPEKSKINDLAEKLLPDDHPYKITDEHGETNPYKQYLNSVEDEKKMEKLGFVKNSDGHWTAQPLGETAEEQTKDKVPLYKRFENEGAYGQLYYDDALKVVRGFLIDEGVIGYEDEEYITITLQKSLLDVFND